MYFYKLGIVLCRVDVFVLLASVVVGYVHNILYELCMYCLLECNSGASKPKTKVLVFETRMWTVCSFRFRIFVFEM